MKWNPIPSTEGCYSASSTGLIRRDKQVKGNCKAGQIVKTRLNNHGYLKVNLSVNGRMIYSTVHRLVAEAFLTRERPTDLQVNHKNGIKTDNRVENLEWCDMTHNRRHAFATGLQKNHPGERANGAKLKNHEVLFIRSARGTISQYKLASLFGVNQVLISRIQLRKCWKHI